MNGLSWLLYLADVAETLRTSLFAVVAVVIVGAMFAGIMAHIDERGSEWLSVVKKFVLPIGLALFVACVLPSRATLMLIAASEVGETVLASQDVQSVGGEAGALATDSLRLLRKYVSEQLGETAAETP